MPEARFLKIIIIVLLLINIGTLGFLWFGGRHNGHRQPPLPGMDLPPRGAAAFLNESLSLTDAQETEYRKLRSSHHQTVEAIRGEMKENKRTLYMLLKTPNPNSVRNEEARWLDSLAAQQRRIEFITYEHFREVRALCTPQQQAKFDEVIDEALEQMR